MFVKTANNIVSADKTKFRSPSDYLPNKQFNYTVTTINNKAGISWKTSGIDPFCPQRTNKRRNPR